MAMYVTGNLNERGIAMIHRHRPPMPPHHPAPHHPEPHLPPHRAMLRLNFDDQELQTLACIFGDEDSAASALVILNEAPAEIQILAVQALGAASVFAGSGPQLTDDSPDPALYMEEAEGRENRVRWSCPVLDGAAGTLFLKNYGDVGQSFCAVLGSAPYEIAVVARILAYVNEKAGENNGHH